MVLHMKGTEDIHVLTMIHRGSSVASRKKVRGMEEERRRSKEVHNL